MRVPLLLGRRAGTSDDFLGPQTFMRPTLLTVPLGEEAPIETVGPTVLVTQSVVHAHRREFVRNENLGCSPGGGIVISGAGEWEAEAQESVLR